MLNNKAVSGEAGTRTADFLSTASIDFLELPAGVTWESESGVFLSASSSNIPAPSTFLIWSLLAALGIGMAGTSYSVSEFRADFRTASTACPTTNGTRLIPSRHSHAFQPGGRVAKSVESPGA